MNSLRYFLAMFTLLFPLVIGCNTATVDIASPAKLEVLTPGFHQKTAHVPDVGQVLYTIQVPPNYDASVPCPLVLLLHYGYEGSKPNMFTGGEMIKAFDAGLSPLNAIVIAPDVTEGDWTYPSNEQAAIWLTQSVMNTYAIDSQRVMVSGYSMGGQGAWYLGSRHQNLFTAVVPVAAPVFENSGRWKTPIYAIHSTSDQIIDYKSAKAHADRVKNSGAKIKFHTVQNVSHYEAARYASHLEEAATWAWNQ